MKKKLISIDNIFKIMNFFKNFILHFLAQIIPKILI